MQFKSTFPEHAPNSSRAMPAIPKNHHASEPIENQYPDFNPPLLRSLTENVESNLKNQRNGPISKDAAVRPKSNTSSTKKKSGERLVMVPVSSFTVRATDNGSTPAQKRKPTVVLKMSQGKKRLRDGHVKDESDRTKGKYVNKIRIGTSTRKNVSENSDKFNQDVRALGGTREDVDLTANIISESEMEGEAVKMNKNQENGLETEILQLIQQIGVDRLAKQDLLADSESEEADKAAELQESWNLAQKSSNARPIGVKPALLTATFAGEGPKSLVSK